MTDIATRLYNHTFKLDPIIRSILDTDIYKLLMLQTIWKEFKDVPVTFSLINRNPSVRIADEVDKGDYSEHRVDDRTIEKDWSLLPTEAEIDLFRRYLAFKDEQAGSVPDDELILQAAAEFEVDEEDIEAAIDAWERWIAG